MKCRFAKPAWIKHRYQTLGKNMLPTPNEIFASFEKGEIEREELHAMLAIHARELIDEMEEDYQNPAAALIESLLAKRATSKLVKKHGARLLREVFMGLAEVRNFSPSKYLWNASHPDVPLHCFLRMRREPVFRVVAIEADATRVLVQVEYGPAKKTEIKKDKIKLIRGADFHLHPQTIGEIY